MQLNRKPLAFVDESGYVIYIHNRISKHKGRFIYTQADLKFAISEMNRKLGKNASVSR